MTGQHRKPKYREGGPVPGPGTFLIRPVDSRAVREAIAGVAAKAINEAAATVRKLRAWCDATEADALNVLASCGCSGDDEPCGSCRGVGERQLALVEEVRALLPPVPAVAEEVDMSDREYPGDGDNAGVDSGN